MNPLHLIVVLALGSSAAYACTCDDAGTYAPTSDVYCTSDTGVVLSHLSATTSRDFTCNNLDAGCACCYCDACEEDSPCENGGTCSNENGGYTCDCPEGYSGDDCELTPLQGPNCADNICYTYVEGPMSATAGVTACSDLGLTMAKISTSAQNDLASSLCTSSRCWNGATDYNGIGFGWPDGSITSFAGWSGGEPNSGAEDCTVMKWSGVLWNDWGCSQDSGIMCSTAGPECEVELNGLCYRSFNDRTNEADAETACNSWGGTLAVASVEGAEMDAIRSLASAEVNRESWFYYNSGGCYSVVKSATHNNDCNSSLTRVCQKSL